MQGGIESGLPDISAHPDLDTLTDLPWEPGALWCLADTTVLGGAAGGGVAPRGRPPGDRQAGRAGPRRDRRTRAGVLPAGAGRLVTAGLAAVRRRSRQRLRRRPQGRPARRPAHDAALPARRLAPRDGGEPRVLRGTVRDQPVPLRPARRRRPRVPDEVRGAGDRTPRGDAGDLHGQALQRRGRQRLPPPRLAGRRGRAPTSSATPTASTACRTPAATRSAACWPTRRRSRRS